MKKILVCGCSVTYGDGLGDNINDSHLWVNQLIKQKWSDCAITNLAQPGKNNSWIFSEVINELSKNRYDLVLVGWTYQQRLNFNVGLELYSTLSLLKDVEVDINVNPYTKYKGKWLSKLGDNIRSFSKDHWYLLDLTKYVNSIINIQKERQSETLFVNVLGTWNNEYFKKKEFNTPSELSEYTREMIQSDTRADNETRDLYNMIHEEYQKYGGIQPNHWLNLYDPLYKHQTDFVSSQNKHPGYHSQDIFVKLLTPKFNEALHNTNL